MNKFKSCSYYKSDNHIENAKIASVIGNYKIQELKKDRIKNYNKKPKKCLYCNNPLEYNKKRNKFCSKSCSASFNNKGRMVTEETKKKIRNKQLKNNDVKIVERECEFCGNKFIVERIKNGRLSKSEHCNSKCSNLSMKKKLSYKQKEKVKNGTHKGWQSRNILSYPEKFFRKVLYNNELIDNCEINYPILKKDLGLNEEGNYFLDFYFRDKKIDLEIDGKQHNYEDRKKSDEIRDKLLKDNKIKVYRIKWKCINNKKGKGYIKNEIYKFLKFYKTAP